MKKIISFSLWGDNPKYTIGAIKNAELAEIVYPGWICRFYVGQSVPLDVIEILKSKNNTEIIIMNEQGDWNSMFWRFYAAADDGVEIMLSRDCDSRLSNREKLCVDEFIKSDKKFHKMIDHPFHGNIMGGRWGAKHGLLSDIIDLISAYVKNNKWQVDQSFLKTVVYPKICHTELVHDAINLKNFPSPRENYHFVGEVFGPDDIRYESYIVFEQPAFKGL